MDKQYRFVKEKKNINEMVAYQLIASSNSYVEYVKVVKLVDTSNPYIAEAIKIATSVQTENYTQFFKLFKSTNYFFACLMLTFFD